MYTDEEWDKVVDDFEGKRATVYCVDGSIYTGIGGPYCEEENSLGENTWAITLNRKETDSMIFLQEDVESIKFY